MYMLYTHVKINFSVMRTSDTNVLLHGLRKYIRSNMLVSIHIHIYLIMRNFKKNVLSTEINRPHT